MKKPMMFIENVMYKILEPVSNMYIEKVRKAIQMSPAELYNKIINNFNIELSQEVNSIQGTTIFATPGCPHNVRNGYHCGCSFCDWNDTYIADPAYVSILREKDPNLYKKMQLQSFDKLRGLNKPAKFFEEFAIHNCFDDGQFTEEEWEFLFEKTKLFSAKPIIGLVQVRAENVTHEKIILWRKMVRKQLVLGIGVETGDEWLRNHWLNKDLYDSDLIHAINIAHDCNCKVSANILIMLPGLNAKQSIQLFIRSVKRMIELGCDSIMLSPLVIKKYTLQNYIDFKQSDNERKDNIFVLIEAIWQLSKLDNRITSKIMFSSLNFADYFAQLEESEELKEAKIMFSSLLEIGGEKDFSSFSEKALNFAQKDSYIEFLSYYEKLDGVAAIKDRIYECADELVKSIYSDNERTEQMILIDKELELWDGVTYE